MWFVVIGLVCIVLSYLYFFRPNIIKKIDEMGTKVVINRRELVDKRVLIGFFYIITGLGLVYIAFYW